MTAKKAEWQRPKKVETKHRADISEIGKKLKKLRENMTGKPSITGFTDENHVHISRTSYAQMERGEIYFNLHNLLKVLDYHGLDLKTFIKTDIENL